MAKIKMKPSELLATAAMYFEADFGCMGMCCAVNCVIHEMNAERKMEIRALKYLAAHKPSVPWGIYWWSIAPRYREVRIDTLWKAALTAEKDGQ